MRPHGGLLLGGAGVRRGVEVLFGAGGGGFDLASAVSRVLYVG